MTATENIKQGGFSNKLANTYEAARAGLLSIEMFRRVIRLTLVTAVLASVYWLFIASDRYVSEANVIIQKTDLVAGPAFDLTTLIGGVGVVNRSDQLLLREYLLSVDMLRKLDAALGLRAHYSNWRKDPISRMWFEDASIEWFHRHYLLRVAVEFDDYAGILRIKAQAYDPKTAQAITDLLVREGERYMNQLGHELALAQVTFLSTQVGLAETRVMQARSAVLEFQNRKGLVSPQAAAESISAIVARLEGQRTEIQTQLASLPAKLVPDHPNIVMLKKSLAAVEAQIAREKAKLASTSGKTLNVTVEEFQRLEMEAAFAQDIYKSALIAMEKGQMDATRMLKKVSVLQAPALPEYPLQPGRVYNTVITLLFALLFAGVVKLLESIVLDHVD
ncbi:chain-length determining protein [Accumulibacter sp.]|uniref:chain-length determining protein n=1 Tax=Accumulibacter sp. TaxID=2053492 RepID=UPI00261D9E88|nr:chain-length determining protein [Accumulibacter sp.]